MIRTQLIAARKSIEKTQEDVAVVAGIDRASYAHIERGTRNPSLDIALKIAAFLGKNVEEIFLPSDVSN